MCYLMYRIRSSLLPGFDRVVRYGVWLTGVAFSELDINNGSMPGTWFPVGVETWVVLLFTPSLCDLDQYYIHKFSISFCTQWVSVILSSENRRVWCYFCTHNFNYCFSPSEAKTKKLSFCLRKIRHVNNFFGRCDWYVVRTDTVVTDRKLTFPHLTLLLCKHEKTQGS